MSTDLELWHKTTEYLRGILNPEVFSNWIEIITPVSVKGNCFLLNVENDFYQDWIETNYKSYILDALKAAGAPGDIAVRFEVSALPDAAPKAEPQKPAHEAEPPRKPRVKANASQTTPLNPTFTFQTFVTGPSNSWTHAAALAVSKEPGRAYNPLFIYGQTGIGKTHLMQAIGNHIVQSSGMSVRYVSSETFLNEYVEAVRNNTLFPALRARYRNTDVLLIDDIQFFCGKGGSVEEFFHTFEVLQNARKQIVITSDLPPKSLKDFEARLISRFESGMVTEIENPDYETRLAILRYKNSLTKIQLSDEVLSFMAHNIKSNVRSLQGALTRSVGYATLTNTVITTDVLQELLKDQLNNERRKDLTCEEIQKSVVDYFSLHPKDMSSDKRTRDITEPRMIAMFLCRKLTSLSLPVIGASFSREHATVVHACKTIQARMQVDKDLFESVKKITSTLGRDPSEITL